MRKADPLLIRRCRILRRSGFSLGDIMEIVNLPKTTVYDYIRDINLSPEIKKRLNEDSIKQFVEFSYRRKGKCLPGKIVYKPKLLSLFFFICYGLKKDCGIIINKITTQRRSLQYK